MRFKGTHIPRNMTTTPCPICLEVSEQFISLVCNDASRGHDMCLACFEAHTATSNTCPQCRTAYDPMDLADVLDRAHSGNGRVVLILEEPYQGPPEERHEERHEEYLEERLADAEAHARRVHFTNVLVFRVITALSVHEPIELTQVDLQGVDHELFYEELNKFHGSIDGLIHQATTRAESKYARRVSTAIHVFLGTFPM